MSVPKNYYTQSLPASVLKLEGDPNGGVFRCQRCDRVLPVELKVVQDGLDFCKPRCADDQSRSEFDQMYANDLARTDSFEPVEDGPIVESTAVATTLNVLSPNPVNLTAGGAGVAITLTGLNLDSADVASFGHASITASGAAWTATQYSATLTAAGGVPAGDYEITYEGSKYKGGIIRVR